MSYKTILVHVDKDNNANERLALAARIAKTEHAHLIGVAATGISRYVYQTRYLIDGGAVVAPLEGHLEALRNASRSMLENFEAVAKRTNVRSWEARAVDDEAGAALCLQARYADLVVIGQTDRDNPAPTTLSDFPEFVVMNSGRPVLLVPHVGQYPKAGSRILVAWDAGTSATRAVTAALPMLKRASHVDVAVFNAEPSEDGHGPQPGSDIALYLARHDVKVNVVRQNSDIDVGNALLSLVADLGADMLVMGGYGHSRFREILLGGVTRTVLASMTVPVLMAH